MAYTPDNRRQKMQMPIGYELLKIETSKMSSVKEKEEIQHGIASAHTFKIPHGASRGIQHSSVFNIPNGTARTIHHSIIFKISNGRARAIHHSTILIIANGTS